MGMRLTDTVKFDSLQSLMTQRLDPTWFEQPSSLNGMEVHLPCQHRTFTKSRPPASNVLELLFCAKFRSSHTVIDAVEDGGAPYAPRIRAQFGNRVADIVEGCTDGVPDENGKKEDWKPRKERYLAHLPKAGHDVLLVSGSDKLHNARAILSDLQRMGVKVFDRFSSSQSDTLWYYDELAKIHIQQATPVAPALRQTVDRMLQLAK